MIKVLLKIQNKLNFYFRKFFAKTELIFVHRNPDNPKTM